MKRKNNSIPAHLSDYQGDGQQIGMIFAIYREEYGEVPLRLAGQATKPAPLPTIISVMRWMSASPPPACFLAGTEWNRRGY